MNFSSLQLSFAEVLCSVQGDSDGGGDDDGDEDGDKKDTERAEAISSRIEELSNKPIMEVVELVKALE